MALKSFLCQLNKITYIQAVRPNIISAVPKTCSQNSFLLASCKPLSSVNFVRQYSHGKYYIPVVSYEEIKKLTCQSHQLLIDVREPTELQETGKIRTSINIPLGQVAQELAQNVEKADFKAKYGRNKPEKYSEIIFHCKSGQRSQKAAELARTMGYANSKNYLGSWLEYAEKEDLPK